jgi:pimeloyl-ACP methyl ester carboxylesterase
MKEKKTPQYWLKIALVLCVIAILGASFVQTAGGKVSVSDMRWETANGRYMSALLFKPEGASAEKPLPAIITSHGWFNNREMQDMNYVEFARRGYVVLSIDMQGHGNSEVLYTTELYPSAVGMYDAIKLIADLPYVDASRIGVTGHSNGAMAANFATDQDNMAETPLIASLLLVANDANYTDPDGAYFDKYGSRDVGIVAAIYDEFFFRTYLADGTYLAPGEYINNANAQSFLNFGIDPAEGEERESYKVYTKDYDGVEAMRVIYNPNQIHPWNTISLNVLSSSLDFFEESLGAPNSIPSDSYVWPWKQAFNILGLVGFSMFVLAFAKVLLNKEFFSDLKSEEEVSAQPAPAGKAKIWYWASLVIGAFVSGYSFIKIPTIESLNLWTNGPGFHIQAPVYFIGIWALANGIFALIMMLIGWFFFGGKEVSLKDRGVTISLQKLWKTILLSLSVVSVSYLIVFVSDYLFKVDFRFWIIPVKAFGPDKFGLILTYLPFFLAFYVLHSIAVNSFNYVEQGKEWINVATLALFTTLGALTVVVVQYSTFFATGKSWTEVMDPSVSNIYGIWAFPVLLYFPLAVIFDRKLFKVTKNPYLGGIIFGVIMTIIACTNTLTQLP